MTVPTLHPTDLEPSLISDRTYSTRRGKLRIDVTTVIGLMLCLLLLLPVRMIVPGMTDLGRPSTIVCLVLGFWWFASRLNPRLAMTGPQPLRWVMLAYLISALLSYAAGQVRGLPTLEANAADLSVIGIAIQAGLVVMVADGIANQERLERVIRVFVACAGVVAFIGVVQSVLEIDITQYLIVPGLEIKGELAGLEGRGEGFFRVASTLTHYIEFSAVMATALPFGIHVARFAPSRLLRQVAAGCTVLIAAAIPLTLSRTGILGLGLAVVAMMPIWTWRMRYNVIILVAGMIGAFILVRPGLLGTLKSLFLSLSEDPSIQGRTDDYSAVYAYFVDRPLLGRGPGTFIPTLYQFLDNQWLGTLVTAGLLGVAVLAAVHIVAMSLAYRALKRATTERDRHLCGALISAQIVAIVCGLTFDSLGFDTYATTLFFLTGLTGVVWRLSHPDHAVRTAMVNSRA